MPRVLITGVAGQDGSYLAELLNVKGYDTHGVYRPGEADVANVCRHEADLTDAQAIRKVVVDCRPDECYHLGAQTFVEGEELETVRVNTLGTMHVLEALRHEAGGCRLFFAGSSEMFGRPACTPQDESTPLSPRNIYGATKIAGYDLLRVYRERDELFACCGFLYNHESPRRSPQFVTRKITRAAARIKLGLDSALQLGNLDAVRDWGYAPDYVHAMWLMLQQNTPDDYVLATGQGRTVQEFVQAAFNVVGLNWREYVRSSREFWREAEAVPLIGNSAKAKKQLDWTPRMPFTDMVREMVEADLPAH